MSQARRTHARCVVRFVATISLALGLTGCCSDDAGLSDDHTQPLQHRLVLNDAEARSIVEAFNARVEPLERFKARANVRLRFRDVSKANDPDAPLREEQPEGLLQVIRPDRLALSLGKAGQTLFWFGCDDREFWWFDLEKAPSATVGERAMLTPAQRERLGLAVAPWEFVALLGITPLPVPSDARGTRVEVARVGLNNQGQDDEVGLIELTVLELAAGTNDQSTTSRPRIRYQLADAQAIPSRVELFDDAGELIAWSELSGVQVVDLKDKPAGAQAEIPAVAYIHSALDETEARVTLTGATDAKIADQSFQLAALLKHFKVPTDRVSRIDSEASKPEPTSAEAAKPKPTQP